MAADSRLRDRAVGHLGRGVVRAARAEVGRALHRVGLVGEDVRRDQLDHALAAVQRRAMPRQPVGEHRQHARGPQFAERREQRRALRVVLAEHARTRALDAVVEMVLDLLLDHRALLLDHQHFLEPLDEALQPRGLERKGQADLVDAHAGRVEVGHRQVEPPQRFHQVEMGLAAGHDAHARARAGRHPAVDAVVLGEVAHRVELGRQPRLDRQARQVGPAIVQAAGRRGEGGWLGPVGDERVEVDGRARFHRLRDRLEADPGARETRQRPAVETELQHVGDVGRVHHRHLPADHREIALVRHRGRDAAVVVVAGHHQHAAMRGGAIGVAVLERVAGAIDAGALAVPHREHALDGALRVGLDALRAEHRRAAQLLVDGGQEAHAGRVEQLLRLPHLLVDHSQRRAAVAADETGRVDRVRGVALALHQHQAHQRLGAGQEHAAARGGEIVGEAVVGEGGGAVQRRAGGHEACLRGLGCGCLSLSVGTIFRRH